MCWPVYFDKSADKHRSTVPQSCGVKPESPCTTPVRRTRQICLLQLGPILISIRSPWIPIDVTRDITAMKIDEKVIRDIAELAQLEVQDEAIPEYAE